MLIKNVTILLTYIFVFFNNSVKADSYNYILGNKEKINERINSFFIKYPNENIVFWVPEINGKSRYSFSIQRNAYLNSKKYLDSSDLYYLSKKIDDGLKFEPNKSKSIDITLLKNNFNTTYMQRHLLGINTGIFFEKKENSFGIILNKDFILSKNSMATIGFKQAKDRYTIFDGKFVKLFNNEGSEIYGNLNYEFNLEILNLGIGHTWFEISNQYDLTVGLEQQDKKVVPNLYVTFGDENRILQIGLNQIEDDTNIFLSLKFENALNKNKFGTNIIVSSKDNIFGLRNLSLKSFRKSKLDMLWKKNINFN